MKKFRIISLAVSLLLLASSATKAADNFTIIATSGGNSATKGFVTAEDFFGGLTLSALQAALPSYTDTSAANISASFRGVPLLFAYAANSTTLTFTLPSLNLTHTFTGATRDASQALFKDFLKSNGQGILSKLMQEAAKFSPNDPLAGNPNSLMGNMVNGNFDTAFDSQAGQLRGNGAAVERTKQVGLGLRFGSLKTKGVNSKATTVPLSISWNYEDDPRRQLVLTIPFTYGVTEGARMYHVAPSLGYVLPVSDRWSVTPALGYGVTGSKDLGSLAQLVSVSAMSMYTIPSASWRLSVGNMVGYYQSLNMKIGDYSANPGITNVAFRNGFLAAQPVSFWGGNQIIEYSWVDTRYVGSPLFMMWYEEIGATIGFSKEAAGLRKYIRLGLGYLFSNDSQGWSAKAGYWF